MTGEHIFILPDCEEKDMGVTPSSRGRATGLRPQPPTASSRSSVPNAGDWVVFRDWNVQARQIAKVTPKLFKLGKGSWSYPLQIGRDKTIAILPDEDSALRFKDALAGIDGEYNRRRAAADQERSKRVAAAGEARDKQITALIARTAQGIEAATADETRSGSAEGESPVPEGNAPNG